MQPQLKSAISLKGATPTPVSLSSFLLLLLLLLPLLLLLLLTTTTGPRQVKITTQAWLTSSQTSQKWRGASSSGSIPTELHPKSRGTFCRGQIGTFVSSARLEGFSHPGQQTRCEPSARHLARPRLVGGRQTDREREREREREKERVGAGGNGKTGDKSWRTEKSAKQVKRAQRPCWMGSRNTGEAVPGPEVATAAEQSRATHLSSMS